MNLRITEHCKMQGITLQELADKMGVARSTLANTLSKGNPTIETLSKIADALGVEVTDLFEKSSDEAEHLDCMYWKRPEGHYSKWRQSHRSRRQCNCSDQRTSD